MNYLVLHGSFGSPFGNWFPYLRSELEKRELTVYTPDMPTGVGYQNYDNWSKVMDAYVSAGVVNENTIVFAHSIAPIFICKYLVEHKIKVKRLILVCGFNNYLGINEEYDAVNESMYFDNLSDVKNCCDDIICLYSDNGGSNRSYPHSTANTYSQKDNQHNTALIPLLCALCYPRCYDLPRYS